ncbi:MAG: hypothetical protein ACMVP2_02240 [Imperialibacter sp.]|jgi:hypothetical protein|uniref:hypothetical protein n=1 Tax=unclassified Imperialibacter TaxID=2629706 RepID=UPI001259C177|nr:MULTISPECIES: hypothetical protein [unclassified Imperialibacter]CAD5278303.1 conserved membrane hypothetical protein [Imperialibacter sp. 89]CAD5292463.1 conserved membrane hypothetical protein [Imperialibacter sp. 75]VVS99765.1 conserved membrane hypothetical protein [Imperialibacter sp. EC-SDR9]|tara:strand:+ start:2485 stop:2808 length:324 start_codon:yes stop_codon:yes gene_type:complete
MDFIDIALIGSYILVGIALLAAIILPLINALDDLSSLAMSAVGILILLVIFGLGYAISGDEVTAVYTKYNVDAGLSKLVGGSLIMMYLLTGVALVGIVYTEISKIVK